MTTLLATEPIIRARLKKASAKQYRHGVLGLRAQPVWSGDGFEHDGAPVTVVACPSVLSIWEALDARDTEGWTVVLTNVDDDDLGDTVLAHLLDGRLITPDPWDALRSNFSASTIEPALYRSTNDRAVANGLLGVLSPDAYTPAPGGVLTRDHAMRAVARDVLEIVKDSDVEVDALAILEWSRSPSASASLADLRTRGGAELAAAVSTWLAGRAGQLTKPLTALLESDRITDLVPLGVVAGLFCPDDGSSDSVALGVFLGRYGLTSLGTEDLNAWYTSARGLLTTALEPAHQQTVLQSAAAIVNDLGIGAAAAASDLLPHGLDTRLSLLADAFTSALPHLLPVDLDAALVAAPALQLIETRWAEAEQHFLAAGSPTVQAFSGAVRLARWLAQPVDPVRGLPDAAVRYVGADSWVDTALVKARRGAETPVAAAALRELIDLVVARRARHDRAFAAALADAPRPAVQTIENVLRELVVPLARRTATLLLVVDALSMPAANDLVSALQQDGWTEMSAGAADRAWALAVLPTLTQRSRCSLLCGELREGADTVERTGFISLIRDAGLQATGGVPDPIFHKRALDAIPSGANLATDVNNAIADTTGQPLVAAILNYVDDTLHHTDPGGTDWNLTTITHLRALLHAAKNAGRALVITSDHGHIIEYGTSAKVNRANTYGQRAHGDFANVDPDREVVVEGPRVLTESQRVVLAVDETVRYGARNAGYHGGALPAEALVPVLTFLPGQLPDWATPVAGVEPSWWYPGTSETPTAVTTSGRKKKTAQEPSLFDVATTEPVSPLPDKVIRSKVFDSQLGLAGRIVVKAPQIKSLLQALLAVGANELTLAQAASALGVATASVNGALMQTKRVLDVEGYEVLQVARGVVRLDVAALKEQFGVSE
ncbi:BREX-2 system phosphatase PglZ [Mycolicibacterium sp. GESEQ-9]|uniref:BREX-2 system phosphatase PglZ n=1 Tax=Mycolicibacterium sp. GESEQ-9 TaxID=2812656 RepID=UPI001B322676|nr:BREX-2 system phosphatase PglZ [Mycolicibacterium sp. GESEQ-9]